MDFRDYLPHVACLCGGRGIVYRPGDGEEPCGCNSQRALSWLIVGGESGPGARPFDLAWARSVIAQGRAAGFPVFVKQLSKYPYDSAARWISRGGPCVINPLSEWTIREPLRDRKGGDWREWPADLRAREWPR